MRGRLAAVAAALLSGVIVPVAGTTAVASAAPAATADSVAPNGQIAFASYDWCCDYDIYVVNPDGTGLTNVTNTPGISESQPVWSPDGSKIGYTRTATVGSGESNTDVWVMNGDGSGQSPLTSAPAEEYMGDWSPDGTRIVYMAYVDGVVVSPQFDIFVMNADGSGQQNITNADTDEMQPSWSPDGDRLVFAAVRPSPGEDWYRWEIVTSDPDGTHETLVTTANDIGGSSYEDHYPSWDPTGEMIVWMSQYDESCCGDWDVWAMNEDGSGKTNLTDDGDYWMGYGDWFPSWSPDGTQITFSSNRADGSSQTIYAMDAPTGPLAGATAPTAPTTSVDQRTIQSGSGQSTSTDGSPTLTMSRTAAAPPGFPVSDDGATPVVHAGEVGGVSWGAASADRTAAVTVTRSGTGAGRVTSVDALINCGRDCTETYVMGRTVKLRARPAAGSTFAGWGGACSGTGTTCTVVVDELNSVRARFTATP